MGIGVSQRHYHGYRDLTRDRDMGIGISRSDYIGLSTSGSCDRCVNHASMM